MFTKQHMIKIATLIGGIENYPERWRIATGFANMLAESNPLFKRDKFLKACNITPQ